MKQIPLIALLLLAAPAFAASECTYDPLETSKRDTVLSDAAGIEQLFDERNLLYRHLELQQRLDDFVASLDLPASDEYVDYRVHLLDDPTPLSFSLPDGQIYLHTGLIARLESSDQLAALLFHEAHHVAAHHHILAARDGRRGRQAGNVGLYLLDAAGMGGGATTLGSAAEMRAQSEFDAAEEAEADRCAVEHLRREEIPEEHAIRVLEILSADTEFVAPRIAGSFASPATLEARRNALRGVIGPSSIAPEADPEFALIARKFQEKTIDDYLSMGAAQTAVAYARGLVDSVGDARAYAFLGDALQALGPQADVPPSIPSKKEARRRARMTQDEIDAELLLTEEGISNQVRNRSAALDAYHEALALDAGLARAHLGLGELQFAQEHYRAAAASLITYLKHEPDSPQKLLVHEKLQQIRKILTQKKEQEDD